MTRALCSDTFHSGKSALNCLRWENACIVAYSTQKPPKFEVPILLQPQLIRKMRLHSFTAEGPECT